MMRAMSILRSAGCFLAVVSALGVAPRGARAQASGESAGPASVFSTGMRGIFLGSAVGASAGYLVARDGGWDKDEDWRTLGYGVAIGALAGAGVGIGLGVADVASPPPVGGMYLQYMAGGATFGTAVGALGGLIGWLSSDDAEHILFGAAIGTLAGTALGAGLAVLEHRRRMPAPARYALTLAPVRDASGATFALPALVGHF